MNKPPPFLAALAVLVALGCSTMHHRESADREVYQLIAERTPEVPGMMPLFRIDPVDLSLEDLPVVTEEPVAVFEGKPGKFLGKDGEAEVGAHILSLEKALEIAVKNSREYQSHKEALYLEALAFTETRQRYRPVFSGKAGGDYSVRTRDAVKLSGSAQVAQAAPGLITDLGALTGAPADLLSDYANVIEAAATATGANAPHTAIEQERSVSGMTSFDVNMLMKGGAQIAVGLTSNFLRFLTGDPDVSTSSALVGTITQPLLGSNRRTAAEIWTQAERDLLYHLRSFTRYRKSFTVNIASAYYGVLQRRDEVRNAWLGYQAFLKDLERAAAEAAVGRITESDLGRTREEELRTNNQWIRAIQNYQDGLDEYKILLGLPTDAKIVLDDTDLERLMERGLMPEPDFTLEGAIKVALAARLDYYTERDQLDDSARQLKLAQDDLKPDLDLDLGGSVNTKPGDHFEDFDFKRYKWSLGLDLDPKLNRKKVRNRYRKSLINYEEAKRSFERFEDDIKLRVRQAWRELEQARISYEIQQNSLKESERRVLHQELLLEAGQGKALDRIDALNALIRARNSVSTALVSHTTANLRLWRDMGILYIKENGQWEDITDV